MPPAEVAALALAVVTVLLALRLNYLEQEGTKRMAGFDAASVVEPLDYDFRTKDNPAGPAGTIREPTDAQIAEFLTGLKTATEKVKDRLPGDIDTSDPAAVVSAIDGLDAAAVIETHQEMAALFAGLCSGSPSREQILQLPMRVRTMFYGWLQTEVMAPEAAPGGGNAQARTLRSVAAG